jgi:hypothetical protein
LDEGFFFAGLLPNHHWDCILPRLRQ